MKKICGLIFVTLVAVSVAAAPMYDRRMSSGNQSPETITKLQGGIIIAWDIVNYGDTLFYWQEILVPVKPSIADIQRALGTEDIPFSLSVIDSAATLSEKGFNQEVINNPNPVLK